MERFVLWSGVLDSRAFRVTSVHVPQQTALELDGGLLVRVDGEALHELNVWLYEHQETLGVQVHAHPTDAFHSHTDDTYPVVAVLGGVSIVAADFCRWGLITKSTAVYRLQKSGWVLVKDEQFIEVEL